MDKKHTLPVDETAVALIAYDGWYSFASSFGQSGGRALQIRVGAYEFRVTENDKEVYRGANAVMAVHAYNGDEFATTSSA